MKLVLENQPFLILHHHVHSTCEVLIHCHKWHISIQYAICDILLHLNERCYMFIRCTCSPCRSPLTSNAYPDRDCHFSSAKTVHDPPLLFDLHRDVSEVYALTPADPEYKHTISVITKVLQLFYIMAHSNGASNSLVCSSEIDYSLSAASIVLHLLSHQT